MDLKNYKINGERIDLQNINKIAEATNQLYEEKCINITLFNKTIHFSKNTIENYSIDFWHMGSLENKDEKRNSNYSNYYNIKPCNNTIYMNQCANCIEHNFSINIRNKSRNKCVYRMSSIALFHQVIAKANTMDSAIKIWKVENYTSRRIKEINLKIRYQKNEFDYLIILNEKEKEYFFITAYPVFEHREKNDLTKEYTSKNAIKITAVACDAVRPDYPNGNWK